MLESGALNTDVKPNHTLQPSFQTGPVVIPIGILDADNPNTVKLDIPDALRYLSVAEGFDGTIVWNLEPPPGVEAFFDNPGVNVDEHFGTRSNDNKTLTVDWSNTDILTRGRSFPYRLRVVVVINGLLIPVVHDPTVHNDPPSI
jgi:hypothetical protein